MTQLTLIGTSDIHAHFQDWNYVRGEQAACGLARLATVIQTLRAQRPHSTLLIDSGDTIQGTPLGTYYGSIAPQTPHPMALGMNYLAYDAMVLGNHDFNYGPTVLHSFIQSAQFPVLSANITDQQDHPIGLPYIFKTLESVKIGILGLTTPRVDVWERPEHIQHLQFNPIIETAQTYIPQLQSQGADVIIAAIHSGVDRLPLNRSAKDWHTDPSTWISNFSLVGENMAIQLAEACPDIDVILSGHTHQRIPELWVNGVLITQPHCFGSHLTTVTLDLEHHSNHWQITRKQATLLSTAEVTADPGILALSEPYHQQTLNYLQQPIGCSTGSFEGRLQARYRHGPLASLINQAQIQAAAMAGFTVDCSLASIYTENDGLPAGSITLQDIYGIAIFDNVLCVLDITGETLIRALEQTACYFQQLEPDNLPEDPKDVLAPGSRPYNWDLYAGINYTLDLTQPVGQRVQSLRLGQDPVTSEQQLRLVVNHYRAQGGGNYPMFQSAPKLWQSQADIREILVKFIKSQPCLDPVLFETTNLTLIPDLYTHYFGRKT